MSKAEQPYVLVSRYSAVLERYTFERYMSEQDKDAWIDDNCDAGISYSSIPKFEVWSLEAYKEYTGN